MQTGRAYSDGVQFIEYDYQTDPCAKVSLLPFEAVVTAVDQAGNPLPDVTIKASTLGIGATVRPAFAVTGSGGSAIFDCRFRLQSKNGVIVFRAEGLVATVTQE